MIDADSYLKYLGGPVPPPLLSVNGLNQKLITAKAKASGECWSFQRMAFHYHSDSQSDLCFIFVVNRAPAAAGKTPPQSVHVIKSQERFSCVKKDPAGAGKTSTRPNMRHKIPGTSFWQNKECVCSSREDLTKLRFTNGFAYSFCWVTCRPIRVVIDHDGEQNLRQPGRPHQTHIHEWLWLFLWLGNRSATLNCNWQCHHGITIYPVIRMITMTQFMGYKGRGVTSCPDGSFCPTSKAKCRDCLAQICIPEY